MAIEYRQWQGYPEWFNPNRGQYEPIHPELTPRGSATSSAGYPGWICKSCSKEYPQNCTNTRCTNVRGKQMCRGPLIRYRSYEEKR